LTKDADTKSLKARNLVWLGALIGADALILYFLIVPGAMETTTLARLGAGRLALSAVVPTFVLIGAWLLPPGLKASLVFWKFQNALPGHEAFTRHGPADHRVDMAALKKNVGALPTKAHEQNALWYKLYRKVGKEVGVADAHKAFLLFRDMAALSFLLTILSPGALAAAGLGLTAVLCAFSLFGLQYIATAVAARNSGVRFVGSVLAEHSLRRVLRAPTKSAGS
jgi:hypothetical protein